MALDDYVRKITENMRDSHLLERARGIVTRGIYAAALSLPLIFAPMADAATVYKNKGVPKLGFEESVRDHGFRGVKLAGIYTNTGRLQRSLRFRNITRAVEQRYGIPKDMLFGMVCQESMGDPTKPNESSDGGLGMVHMQPYMASRYGMHLISPSGKLVDTKQGRKILAELRERRFVLSELVESDDRFHPIKAVDAAGRILADHFIDTGDWDLALKRFSGRPHWQYGANVRNYMRLVQSTRAIRNIKNDFNTRNAGKKTADGNPITFDFYIKSFQAMNENYGLERYKRLAADPAANHRKPAAPKQTKKRK